jgi:hypothetical protein
MKMNELHALMTRTDMRASLLYKAFAAAVILAMLLAAFSVSSVLAARGGLSKGDLESAWQNKVKQLRAEIAIANRLQLVPTEVQGCSRQEQAQIMAGTAVTTQQGDDQQVQTGTGQLKRNSCFFTWQQSQNQLGRYRAALAQAQALLVNGGFNANGEVTDLTQARISVQTMGGLLAIMRNIRLNTEGLMKTNLNNNLTPANPTP